MKILDFFKGLFFKITNTLGGFFKQVFTSATQLFLAQVKDIAINAVSELEGVDMSNEDKRKEAFNKISAYALSKGLSLKANLINLAISMALEFIRNKIEG